MIDKEPLNEEKGNGIIEQLKPYPIAKVERKLRELRYSDEFTDIERKSRAPKGKFCDNCEHITTKYEPRICSWNDEVTGMIDYAYCEFFNAPLTAEKENGCYNRYRKCLGCLLQTASKDDKGDSK